jgi:predicted Zn-dependent peptidase
MIYFWILLLPFFSLAADGLQQFKLENGITVLLQPLAGDEEVFVSLVAQGGFASLPEKDQTAGKIAAEVMWEAGLEGYSSDQLSTLLYDKSVEVNVAFGPLWRKIEGSAWKESTDTLFELMQLLFISGNRPEKAVSEGLKTYIQKFESDQKFKEIHFETVSHLLNSNQWPPFKPISLEEVKKTEPTTIASFYQAAFSNPESFTLVIVGDIEPDKIKATLKRTLGSLPKKESALFNTPPPLPSFPQKNETMTLVQKGRRDATCRLTYETAGENTPQAMKEMEFLCKILDAALREKLTEKGSFTFGIDMSYELPFFPRTTSIWIYTQFYAPESEILPLAEKIKTFLNDITTHPLKPEWIETAKEESASMEGFWKNDPSVRMNQLAGASLFGWKADAAAEWDAAPDLDKSKWESFMRRTLKTTPSTQLIATP